MRQRHTNQLLISNLLGCILTLVYFQVNFVLSTHIVLTSCMNAKPSQYSSLNILFSSQHFLTELLLLLMCNLSQCPCPFFCLFHIYSVHLVLILYQSCPFLATGISLSERFDIPFLPFFLLNLVKLLTSCSLLQP